MGAKLDGMTGIYLELGHKKVFACSLDWPGWARVDRSEEAAIAHLMDYVPRYRVVAERAGLVFEPGDPVVVERVKGGTTTDFGAPQSMPDADREPVDADTAQRDVALLRAAWVLFDETAAATPEELRKGPRGGGRDRTKMVDHVVEAERSYTRQLGIRHPPYKSAADRDAMREELAAALSQPWDGALDHPWTPRYVTRRVVWHVLDHLWEMEDKRSV
ncbi:hypothetical protein ACIBG8_13820 [Nonomuraea sp. NPDC050556]|uniref:hypothetical protein n=1 Tax=Nonomuraea sp. NPDC050556 TaxID=3364369 RepID=UPI00379C36A3